MDKIVHLVMLNSYFLLYKLSSVTAVVKDAQE